MSTKDDFVTLVSTGRADHKAVAQLFDGISADDRLRLLPEVPGKLMGKLYQACAGAAPVKATDTVNSDGATVIYAGKNSLPLFTAFQKRLASRDGQVVGYNHQLMSPLTGPGYFIVSDDPTGELLFDYTHVPSTAPAGWPEVASNDNSGIAGASRLVYGNMKDYCRRVSTDGRVLIGSAYKNGKSIDSYFLLVRQ